MRWFERQRMDYIAELLKRQGFIQRIDLMDKFEISAPQAAKDFGTFQKMCPGLMEYDRVLKCYVFRGDV